MVVFKYWTLTIIWSITLSTELSIIIPLYNSEKCPDSVCPQINNNVEIILKTFSKLGANINRIGIKNKNFFQVKI